MLFGPDAEKCQIIGGVQFPHNTGSFICQLTNQPSILNSGSIVQSRLDWYSWKSGVCVTKMKWEKQWFNMGHTFIVNDHNTNDPFVGLDTFKSFLDLAVRRLLEKMKSYWARKNINRNNFNAWFTIFASLFFRKCSHLSDSRSLTHQCLTMYTTTEDLYRCDSKQKYRCNSSNCDRYKAEVTKETRSGKKWWFIFQKVFETCWGTRFFPFKRWYGMYVQDYCKS